METENSNSKIEYASFGLRVAVLVVDLLIIAVSYIFLFTQILIPLLKNYGTTNGELDGKIAVGLVITYFFGIPILGILYRALFECSKLQGTPGKAIVGIKVVNNNFKRISLLKALLRNLVKIVSSTVFYIGYLVAIGNEKCVTWHDSAADTFVIRK